MDNAQEQLLTVVTGREDIANPDLLAVYDYWSNVRCDRTMPDPANIDLLELDSHLNNLYLFDVVDGGADHQCVYDGNFHKLEVPVFQIGMKIDSLPASDFKDRVLLVFNGAVRHQQPVLLGQTQSSMAGHEFKVIDILCLPLSENGRDVSRTLTILKRTDDMQVETGR